MSNRFLRKNFRGITLGDNSKYELSPIFYDFNDILFQILNYIQPTHFRLSGTGIPLAV